MDHRDQRKRAFSQAFQLIYQPRLGDNHPQPAKRVLSYPLNSTDLCLQSVSQENTITLDLDCASAFDEVPGTQIRHTTPLHLLYGDTVSCNYASQHYELYGDEPGPGIQAGSKNNQALVIPDERLRGLPQYELPLPTPTVVRGQSMFGPPTHIRPDSNLPSISIMDPYVQQRAGSANFSTTGSPLSDVTTAVCPLTPSALNFGDLSLNSREYSIPPSPFQCSRQHNRTTVTIVSNASFVKYFSGTNLNEVIIVFDRGKEIRKVDKYPLCSASRFFAHLLDGPFLDQGLTRRIHLRDDFPYAITTMLHFIETGHYVLDERAFQRFPLLTTLDFHIHVHLLSNKYGITKLQDCVVGAYLGIAENELELGFLTLFDDQISNIQIHMPGFPITAPVHGHASDDALITPIDRFLNSLVLLWKNTQSRYDDLREAVLELIKHNLNKLLRVAFFVTLLQEMSGFGDDVVASLGEDGFEVQAYEVAAGGKQICTVRFAI